MKPAAARSAAASARVRPSPSARGNQRTYRAPSGRASRASAMEGGSSRRTGRRARGAVEAGHLGPQELQVVEELGQGADGRAARSHRVRPVDGDGRRDALDGVHGGAVHPVEELAGVGGERLDVAPLALGVERVEGEGRLARARHPGDDGQAAQGEVHVHAAQVVLAGASDADGGDVHGDRDSGRRWARASGGRAILRAGETSPLPPSQPGATLPTSFGPRPPEGSRSSPVPIPIEGR